MIGEKKIKHLAKQSFSVFRGVPSPPLKTLKLFFSKIIHYFLFTVMKKKPFFLSFQDFLHNNNVFVTETF